MKSLFGLIAAVGLSASLVLPAASQDVPQETVDSIVALLAEMKCEMDTDDIEVEDGGYELDDVFCEDGQYDIDLDQDLQVTNKRKE